MRKTLTITNDIRELAVMNRFLEEAGVAFGWDESAVLNLNLVMEEAVSNVIFYAYEEGEKGKTIRIDLVYEAPGLTVTVTDSGRLFDPTLREEPDISLSADERPIGGLGIFLIKKIMDEVTYRREGDCNVLVMKKKVETTNQTIKKDMEVKIVEGPEAVIRVSGRLDTNTCPDFEERIKPVLEGTVPAVKVDCSDLEYVSSAGLRQFLLLHKHIASKGGNLILCGLRPAVKEIFNVTGFSAIFHIE